MTPFKPLPRGRRTTEFQHISPTGRPMDRSAGQPGPSASSRPRPAAPAPRPAGQPPECWRVVRVARHLDVSRKRIYQLVEEGRLEAVRIGPRGMRILVPSIERYLGRLLTEENGGDQ